MKEQEPDNPGTSLPKKARMASGVSQPEMARKAGVSVTTIGKWEKDPDQHMTPARLRAYHERLDPYGRRILRDYVEGILPPEDGTKTKEK